MTKSNFNELIEKEFRNAQIQEMKKYKWIESEKAGYDIGANCILEWIDKFAADFRKEFYEKKGNKNRKL